MELVVGRIGRAHGLRGEVSVEVRTDSPEARFVPGAILDAAVDPRPKALTVESVHWHSGRLLVAFEGIEDRTAAEQLRGALLSVDAPDDETTDDPDEFFDHQLIGLRALTTDGTHLGAIEEVIHLPMQDLLAVRDEAGREILVPFVAEIVTSVDLLAKQAVIDPPPGLLGDE